MVKASIIVPCYNEEENIEPLVNRFHAISRKYPNMELILVDNGSRDGTLEKIDNCCSRFGFVKKVVVAENRGYGYGILEGLKEATGDWLGWMHADLQSDPQVFCEMFDQAHLEKGDFLYKGKRTKRPLVDTFFTIGMSLFETVYLRKVLWDINAQPTLLSRAYYEKWDNPPYDFSLDLYVYYYAKVCEGVRIKRFESQQQKRLNGMSTWNTGMSARMKLIKRVLAYSKEIKNWYK